MRVEPRKAAVVWRVYQSFSESPSDRESESEGASSDITHTTNLIRDRRLSCVFSPSLTYRKNIIYRVPFKSLL